LRPARAHPLAAVLPVFLVTRAAIFFAATAATDSIVYHQYGVRARVASVAALFRDHDAEYPQLAVAFSAAVGWVADLLPDGAERVISARRSTPPDTGTARFQVALGLVLFAIDLGLLLLVARLTVGAGPRERTWRLGLYVAGTAALGPILYDRLDLVVGAVAVLAVCARGRPVVAYAQLAAGAAFKLVPVLLVPVFVLAAAARAPRWGPAVVRQGMVAGLVLAAWPVLAYLFGGGDRAFVFLRYHGERGLELGSAYTAPAFLAAGGIVRYEFGGYVVRGPTVDAVARLTPLVAAAGLGLAVLAAGRALRRTGGERSVLAAGCALVWSAFILTSKVGSPQYLLWVAPLVPLLPLRTRGDYARAVGFVVAAGLATLTYPYLWTNVHGPSVAEPPGTWAGPNPLGLALLIARWAAVAVVAGSLFARLWCVPPPPEGP
jgi:hypothetical protein